MNLVSKMTRQDVSVALSSDGGDEMFAGYNKLRPGTCARKDNPRPADASESGDGWSVTAVTPAMWHSVSRLISKQRMGG
jgi:asparagine synthase (glutamine-hydrolysing)